MRTIGRTVLALLAVVLLAPACSSKHSSSEASTATSPVATAASLPAAITSSAASPTPSSALSSSGSSTPPPTAPPTTQGGSARLVLTDKDADGGAATRTVKVGTIIEVDLTVPPPSGVRAARSSNEAVVATISARGDESSASQTVFRAVAPGTANLYAMIDAACAPNVGCGAAAVYSFAISVVPAR
jgi:hypothetical protein